MGLLEDIMMGALPSGHFTRDPYAHDDVMTWDRLRQWPGIIEATWDQATHTLFVRVTDGCDIDGLRERMPLGTRLESRVDVVESDRRRLNKQHAVDVQQSDGPRTPTDPRRGAGSRRGRR